MNTSEELEQEIARVWKTLDDDFVYQLHWEDFREAAIHFVNWQRERMMKEAKEVEVRILDGLSNIHCGLTRLGLKDNDKVKLLIIKAED